jgi:serine/threonine-protein kinase RsbT
MLSDSQEIMPSPVTIRSDLDIVVVRMAARDLSRRIGFNTIDQARIATVASELARNILMHASEGTMTLRVAQHSNCPGIEMIFENHGPGLEPHYHPPEHPGIDGTNSNGTDSSATNGHQEKVSGLVATRRMVDEMEIARASQQGTTIICRKWLY